MNGWGSEWDSWLVVITGGISRVLGYYSVFVLWLLAAHVVKLFRSVTRLIPCN